MPPSASSLLGVVFLLAACPSKPGDADAGDDGGTMMPTDAGSDGGSDAGVDAGLPAYDRTLITRPLMPTSPKNLIRDPFIGGDGNTSYGQFRAVVDNLPNDFPLSRTFQSLSPVGGAVSIEELRDLPADAGSAAHGRVLSSFHGGAGDFSASIWVSAGDASAAPVPFASASGAIVVSLLDNIGSSQVLLVAGPVQKFGDREWVQYTTQGTSSIPRGGWLQVTLSDLHLTLQLAAPEVTTSSLGAKVHRGQAVRVPMTADDLRARDLAAQLDRQAPDSPRLRQRDDR